MPSIRRRKFLKSVSAALGAAPLLGACGGGGGGGEPASNARECTVTGVPSSKPPLLPSGPALPAISNTALPRLRGAHLNEYADWTDPHYSGWIQLPQLPAWGANVLRVFLCPFDQTGAPYSPGSPLKDRLAASLASRQPVIEWCLSNNVHVMLCFSSFLIWPVSRNWPEDDGRSLWRDASAQSELMAAWAALAERFKGRPGLIFEILNEPQPHYPGSPNGDERLPAGALNKLYPPVIEAIRAVDPERWVAIGPEWNFADYIDELAPIADPRLLYAVHFYTPSSVTHQGIADPSTAGTVHYPTSGGQFETALNKATLEAALKPALDYQAAHGVRIAVTEFGCSKTAPAETRLAWTTDVYSLFEAWGWDSVIFRYEAGMWPACFRQSWALENSEIEGLCRSIFARNLPTA